MKRSSASQAVSLVLVGVGWLLLRSAEACVTPTPVPYPACTVAPCPTEPSTCGPVEGHPEYTKTPVCSGFSGHITKTMGGVKLAYTSKFQCQGPVCVQSCGFYHFNAFQSLRVDTGESVATTIMGTCEPAIDLSCGAAPDGTFDLVVDPQLHPEVLCPDGPPYCSLQVVDGENGTGGSRVVSRDVVGSTSWSSNCPPLPAGPVPLSALINAVDVQFLYSSSAIPRHPDADDMTITVRVNPESVVLDVPSPGRDSGVGSADMRGQRAVVVRIADPFRQSAPDPEADCWACFLWTDDREHSFQWDGLVYHYINGELQDERSYLKGSDLEMKAYVWVKDRTLTGAGCPTYIESHKQLDPIPNKSFPIKGLSDDLLVVNAIEGTPTPDTTDLWFMVSDEHMLNERIPKDRIFKYSFWVQSGLNKIDVYLADGETLLEDPDSPVPRWDTLPEEPPPATPRPRMPEKVVIKTKPIPPPPSPTPPVSSAYGDVKFRFQVHRVNADGAILESYPSTVLPMTVARVEKFAIYDPANPCNIAPADPPEKRLDNWSPGQPLPPQINYLLMPWREAEPQPSVGAYIEITPNDPSTISRFGWHIVGVNVTYSQLVRAANYQQFLGLAPFPDVAYPTFDISLKIDRDGDSLALPAGPSYWFPSPQYFEASLHANRMILIRNVDHYLAEYCLDVVRQFGGLLFDLPLARALLGRFLDGSDYEIEVEGQEPTQVSGSASGCHTCLTINAGGIFPLISSPFACASCSAAIARHHFPVPTATPYEEPYTSRLFAQSAAMHPLVWYLIKSRWPSYEAIEFAAMDPDPTPIPDIGPLPDSLFDVPDDPVTGGDDYFGFNEGLVKGLTLKSVTLGLRALPEGGVYIDVDIHASLYDLFDFDFWFNQLAEWGATVQVFEDPSDPGEGHVYEASYELESHRVRYWWSPYADPTAQRDPHKCTFSQDPD